MSKKKLIDFLLPTNGLPENMTWTEVGAKFNFIPPDTKRAKFDVRYVKEYQRGKAKRLWDEYLLQKESLQLTREVYDKNGNIVSETYKKVPVEKEVDLEDMELEAITTNPHGGAWHKYKKKSTVFNDEHIESLRELLKKDIEPIQIEVRETDNGKALFIHSADKHFGALTKLNSVYTNEYDKKEIRRRIVLETLKNIQELVVEFGVFDSIFYMDYGDALDGYNQKTTGGLRGTSSHTLPQQMDNREQHDNYVELHKELFYNIVLHPFAVNLYFIATCNSNHGGDFEYGAMRHLEEYLNVKYPQIKTFVSDKPLNHFEYGEHCIIFGHGKDDEDMKNGLPLTLNDKVENYIADYIRVNKLEGKTISIITADLHQSAETYGKNFRYRKVLSQYGSSKWMHTNFGSGTPGISYEIFYKNSPRIFKLDEFFNIGNQSNTGLQL